MGFLRAAFATTLNVLLNAVTLGRYLFLEGRVRGGFFKNWGRRFGYQPKRFIQPTSEQEIVDLVTGAEHVRAFASRPIPVLFLGLRAQNAVSWCRAPEPHRKYHGSRC